jgi:hypothetical protein
MCVWALADSVMVCQCHLLDAFFQQAGAASPTLIMPAAPELVVPKYCESIHQTRRRPTRTVQVHEASSLTMYSNRAQPPVMSDIVNHNMSRSLFCMPN